MNQFHGTYHASDNLDYEYDATWTEHAAGLLWSATIVRDRRVLAHPNGLMPGITPDRGEPQSLVRNAIHEAIERLSAAPAS